MAIDRFLYKKLLNFFFSEFNKNQKRKIESSFRLPDLLWLLLLFFAVDTIVYIFFSFLIVKLYLNLIFFSSNKLI